jgi:predicted MFS family arabinose efflux permease
MVHGAILPWRDARYRPDMFAAYREALRLPGTLRFSATGFVARLPVAMVGLGIVLLVSGTTGSYAAAGVLSAAFQLPAALGAVISSRWIDRVGQHRLLPWLASLNATFLILFVVTVERSAPFVLQIVVVALAGICQPAIGSMVRARWASATQGGPLLRSAFALESILDEGVFTVGPLVTAFLAFQIGLPLPVILGAGLGLAGGLALALQRRTEPIPRRTAPVGDAVHHRGAIRQPGVLLVVAAAIGVGTVFGSFEVAVVAFTQQAGSPGSSGIVLAIWALGSMLGGIWFGSRSWRMTLGRQVMLLSGLLAVALLLAPFSPSILFLAGATTVAGVAIAPTLIALFSLTERLVPAHQLTEGLTWTNSGLAIGFSAGTAGAGLLVDAFGPAWGFVLSVVGATLASVVAVAGQGSFRRADTAKPPSEPVQAWIDDPLPGPQPGAIADDPR